MNQPSWLKINEIMKSFIKNMIKAYFEGCADYYK